MKLSDEIAQAAADKDILLMTHIVLGYPSFETNKEVIAQMVANGVDLIEMQIPFSEPMADGPVIIKANQDSLLDGTRLNDCLNFARQMTETHAIPFLFMTYYNILFKYGIESFCRRALETGIRGFIVPDLPPEEGADYLKYTRQYGLAPIQIFAPTSTPERMRFLAEAGGGFIYCVARRGVTGTQTTFDEEFNNYIAQCRASTDMPLAVGFGISNRDDVQSLVGKADIAVIGSETIRLVDRQGAAAVGPFIAGLR
ncbi:MAG TPA: tryptophan synthase subunit alpha [Desulfobacterales bacterium]|nr:tryptophan synthase subunit alpha [Desulfobacterales bacterium]